jgi:hypothetical protein
VGTHRYWKVSEAMVIQKCKEVTCDLLCQFESMDDVEIFTDFLHAVNTSSGTLGRKILLFIDNYAAHAPDILSGM